MRATVNPARKCPAAAVSPGPVSSLTATVPRFARPCAASDAASSQPRFDESSRHDADGPGASPARMNLGATTATEMSGAAANSAA